MTSRSINVYHDDTREELRVTKSEVCSLPFLDSKMWPDHGWYFSDKVVIAQVDLPLSSVYQAEVMTVWVPCKLSSIYPDITCTVDWGSSLPYCLYLLFNVWLLADFQLHEKFQICLVIIVTVVLVIGHLDVAKAWYTFLGHCESEKCEALHDNLVVLRALSLSEVVNNQ